MTDVAEMLVQRQRNLARLRAENDLMERQALDFETRAVKAAETLDLVRQGFTFLEEVANSRRGGMKGRIESVVSDALKLIYGPDYRVEMSYCVKNNRSCLDIALLKQSCVGEVRHSLGRYGLGVADTISTPLRLMVMLGSRQTDRVVVLDECYKYVDAERIVLVAEFLRQMSERLGVQIIMCSHHERMREHADRAYRIAEVNGKSSITVV